MAIVKKKIAMAALLAILGAGTAHAQAHLDYAIRSAAESLSAGFETGARIAVASMQAGSDRMSNYLIDGMVDTLVGMGRFAVVLRGDVELALLRDELDFNMSWEVDEATAQSIGRFFGAQLIVTGVFEPHGNAHRLRVRVIDVETAVIRVSHTETIRGDRVVRYLLGEADPTRFWSVGASVGTAFADPWVIGTLQVTLAPLPRSFIRIGCDLGFISNLPNVEGFFSVFPFASYAFFLPFDALPFPFAWHIGAGGGLFIEEIRVPGTVIRNRLLLADFTTGFNVGNILDISYSLRTNFSTWFMHKVAMGFTYRFQ